MTEVKRPWTRETLWYEQSSPVVSIDIVPGSMKARAYIDIYWETLWKVPQGNKVESLVVPNGAMSLVFNEDWAPWDAFLTGTRKISYKAEFAGSGGMMGVNFKPGGAASLTAGRASQFSGKKMTLASLIGEKAESLKAEIFSQGTFIEQCAVLDRFFEEVLPTTVDQNMLLVQEVVNFITISPDVPTLGDLCDRFSINLRRLQRLFSEYVGVSPKTIIRVKRFHKAAAEMVCGTLVEWSQLALDLGYSDQSHFINDFRKITGFTPEYYNERFV
ncbi:MAG: helix-turn-helix domain-containing protein [Oligoflexales bacterium]